MSSERICEECGDELAAEGYLFCTGCLPKAAPYRAPSSSRPLPLTGRILGALAAARGALTRTQLADELYQARGPRAWAQERREDHVDRALVALIRRELVRTHVELVRRGVAHAARYELTVLGRELVVGSMLKPKDEGSTP